MKRYLAFVMDHYYPAGGWNDLKGSYDTLEQAKANTMVSNGQSADIVDLESGAVVAYWNIDKWGQEV